MVAVIIPFQFPEDEGYTFSVILDLFFFWRRMSFLIIKKISDRRNFVNKQEISGRRCGEQSIKNATNLSHFMEEVQGN